MLLLSKGHHIERPLTIVCPMEFKSSISTNEEPQQQEANWQEYIATKESLGTNLSPFKCETKAKSFCGSLKRKPIYFRLMCVAEAKAEEKPEDWSYITYLLLSHALTQPATQGLLPGNQAVATIKTNIIVQLRIL